MVQGRRIEIHGTVQGVGFRPWVYRLAQDEGLDGRVRNDGQGVTIEAFGGEPAIERFLTRLRENLPPAACIQSMSTSVIAAERVEGFVIDASVTAGGHHMSMPPDLATCPACDAEMKDPSNRRYRYPFINCTDCGPRFTIATGVPYDRAATSMARFVMCPECQREYDDPLSRRFHAQPNACPVCGPTLVAATPHGQPIACEDAVAFAADAIRAGQIVAVKGIGGFHLACDATSAEAVAQLRARKRRDEKPFAVMVRTLADAEALAEIDDAERALLTSVERPIVLLRRKMGSGLCSVLADGIAPGNPLIGLMLPYSPLHHLLLEDTHRPIVLTSGNVSDEPIAYRNGDAFQRLGALADVFLVHDRDIIARADDSVARVIDGGPTILRRARGYVPRPVPLARPVSRPVLATGALLKNTVCLAAGNEAWMGPHIGDLDNLETFESFDEAIDRMQRFLGITPEVIAHDLHPAYHSTRYALARPEREKVGVQHHHAHVASVMAERGVVGPVIGVAFDGTGYGLDGTAWGGEVLVADAMRFTRVATLRAVRLAGGDQAIRQPWRLTLALLDDAFDGQPPIDALGVFDAVPACDRRVVVEMLATGVQVARAHGAGRYFDAIGALLLRRTRATYEGQVALELNAIADDRESGWYPFDLLHGELIEIDLRRGVRALVHDLLAGLSPARLSARFHRTIAAATATVIDLVTAEHGPLPVAFTGGCFQNALLVDDLRRRLDGRPVLTHRLVPPGDGGLALGQAVVADAVLNS